MASKYTAQKVVELLSDTDYIEEAPMDGGLYARSAGAWKDISAEWEELTPSLYLAGPISIGTVVDGHVFDIICDADALSSPVTYVAEPDGPYTADLVSRGISEGTHQYEEDIDVTLRLAGVPAGSYLLTITASSFSEGGAALSSVLKTAFIIV